MPVTSLPREGILVKQFLVVSGKIHWLCQKCMSDEMADPTIETIADGTPVRSEEIGFSPAELNPCPSCSRANPPDRLKCLYCGKDLEIKPEFAGRIRADLRKLDEWESGFNVIVRPGKMPVSDSNERIAALVGIDVSEVADLIAADGPMPLGRFETQHEADIIAGELRDHGLSVVVVADTDLAPDRSPTRLRAIEFGEDEVTFVSFNNDECTTMALAHIVLLVIGVISEKKTDQVEKRKLRGGSTLLDETETSSDETVLDIYARKDTNGYRVFLTGFDFSCLGDSKDILAVKNMRHLVSKLSDLSPNAKLIANYDDLQHAISAVWDLDRRTDSQGMQRSGFGKFNLGKSASTSNLRQFNRYSRMHRHLV